LEAGADYDAVDSENNHPAHKLVETHDLNYHHVDFKFQFNKNIAIYSSPENTSLLSDPSDILQS